MPISAEYNGDDFSSPGIDHSDYSRMHQQQRKQSGERRLPTPVWAMRPDLLRQVIVHFVERRAEFYQLQPGTEKERLARASQKSAERCKRNEVVLRNLCSRFVELKKSNADPAAIASLKIQIENLDTRLRIDRNIAGIVLRVAHLYYGVRLDSVGVATEMGIKPPHVRALIWKLNWCWDKLHGKAKPRNKRPKTIVKEIASMAAKGISYTIIGERFDKTRSQIYYLLKKAKLWTPRVMLDKPSIPRTPNQKGRSPYLEHQHFSADRAIGLYLAGKSVPEIALAFGYAPRTGQNRTRGVLIAAGVYKSKS